MLGVSIALVGKSRPAALGNTTCVKYDQWSIYFQSFALNLNHLKPNCLMNALLGCTTTMRERTSSVGRYHNVGQHVH